MSVNTKYYQELDRIYGDESRIPNTPLPMSLMAQEGNGAVTKEIIKTLTVLHLDEIINNPHVSIMSGEVFFFNLLDIDDRFILIVHVEDYFVSLELIRDMTTNFKRINYGSIPMVKTGDFADRLYDFIRDAVSSI